MVAKFHRIGNTQSNVDYLPFKVRVYETWCTSDFADQQTLLNSLIFKLISTSLSPGIRNVHELQTVVNLDRAPICGISPNLLIPKLLRKLPLLLVQIGRDSQILSPTTHH